MDRRHFVAWAAVAGAGSLDRTARALLSSTARAPRGGAQPRAPYQAPPVITPDGATLVARSHAVEIAPGVRSEVWSVGDGPVGPTIRARTGDTARLTLRNELAEPTIHGRGDRLEPTVDLGVAGGQQPVEGPRGLHALIGEPAAEPDREDSPADGEQRKE
jgi:FtsP/CotA-like multicopper oxidase with cupredoxin domain